MNIEGVLRDAIDRQPIVGLLLQERGFRLDDIASKLPASNATRQTVLSSAVKLYRLNCHTAAALILTFSVAVPVLKQAVFLLAVLFPRDAPRRLVSTASALHKWAMLDVFALAMVVLALSSATAWNAMLLDGFCWFLGYVLSAGVLGALLASKRFGPAQEKAADGANPFDRVTLLFVRLEGRDDGLLAYLPSDRYSGRDGIRDFIRGIANDWPDVAERGRLAAEVGRFLQSPGSIVFTAEAARFLTGEAFFEGVTDAQKGMANGVTRRLSFVAK